MLSLPEGMRASRFSTADSLVKPSPSAGISRGPFRPISPRAVHAATASSALLLSRKEPGWKHIQVDGIICVDIKSLMAKKCFVIGRRLTIPFTSPSKNPGK